MLRIPNNTAPMRMFGGRVRCSLPGLFSRGNITRDIYHALHVEDSKTGLIIETLSALLFLDLVSNKKAIPELMSIGIKLIPKIVRDALKSTSMTR